MFRLRRSAAFVTVALVTTSFLAPLPVRSSELGYLLPIHEIELTTTRTEKFSTEFRRVDRAPIPGDQPWLVVFGPCLEAVDDTKNKIEATVALWTTPDASVGRVAVPTVAKKSADLEVLVSLSPEGYLAGVNAAATGRGPEIVRNVASAVGQVLGAALSFGVLTSGNPVGAGPAVPTWKGSDFVGDQARFACAKTSNDPTSIPNAAPPAADLMPNPCDPFAGDQIRLPASARFVLATSPSACAVHLGAAAVAKQVEKLGADQDRILADSVKASPDAAKVLKIRLDATRELLLDARKELSARISTLQSMIDAALADAGRRGAKVHPASKKRVALADIAAPPAASYNITQLPTDDQDRLHSLGATVLGRPLVAVPGPPPSATDVPAPKAGTLSYVFRQPIPMEIQIVRCKQRDSQDKCIAIEVDPAQTVLVLHPKTALASMAFSPKAFGSNKLALTFAPAGVPSTISLTSSSSTAAWTGALADGLKAVRTEYVATLEGLVTAEEKKRALETADLTTELEKLTKQKSILDQSLSLQAGRASYDTLLEKQKLESDLALLQTQLNLDVAKSTLEFKRDTQILAAEVARLMQEIEILKRRVELAELQTKK